jgi:hypothetical protein
LFSRPNTTDIECDVTQSITLANFRPHTTEASSLAFSALMDDRTHTNRSVSMGPGQFLNLQPTLRKHRTHQSAPLYARRHPSPASTQAWVFTMATP